MSMSKRCFEPKSVNAGLPLASDSKLNWKELSLHMMPTGHSNVNSVPGFFTILVKLILQILYAS